ncbi:MAG: M28 family peptidase [Chitinophagaceae bacterium]|nr:MAG: M28 family peptidase [Chitinophagaceae bacterium]
MKRILLATALLAAFAGNAQKKSNPQVFAATINEADMRRHLFTLAGPEMEGRETATEGQRKAAAYIENYFRQLGLEPGNNGSYQQMYNVYQDSLVRAGLEVNGTAFALDKDFYFQNLGGMSSATYRFSEAVFVGGGVDDSTSSDYKGLNVRGRLVIAWGSGAPAGVRTITALAKVENAIRNGAAAILFISKDLPRKNPTISRGNMTMTGFRKSIAPQTFYVSEAVARSIMGASLDSAQNGTITMREFTADVLLDVAKQTRSMQSSNVLGVLPGTDLKDEYLFITAHYDHLGKRDTVIFYGADDDGSGTTGVLEMAEAFSLAKKAGRGPRRTIVFMCVSGEEKGLWGSQYYSEHPIFPLEKTTADLNIDMIGRGDATRKDAAGNVDTLNYVYVVGDDKVSSDLRPISEGVNRKYVKMQLDYKFNDPKDPNQIYFRSDHYNFARKGVPIIFYYDGMLGADYHRPTDTPDKINYALMARRAQLVFFTAWEMASRKEMLKRDRPLPNTRMR